MTAAANRFKDYIFLDRKSTTQGDGRIVYIDPRLLKSLIDNVFSMRNGPGLANKIVGDLGLLKNQAGDINSQSSQKAAGVHRSNFGSVQVTYTIVQDNTEQNRGPGVYISNINTLDIGPGGEKEKTRPGFYLVEGGQNEWRIDESQGQLNEIPTVVGAIGAEADPNHYYDARTTAQFYGETIHSVGANSQNMFSLFYCPGFIIDELGTWLSPEQKKLDSGQHKKSLATIFKKSVEQSEWATNYISQHQWFVFTNGAKLLTGALEEYQSMANGKPLSKHRFSLVNPLKNLGPLLSKLEALGASAEITTINSFSSKLHQIMNFNDYKNSRTFPSPASLTSFSNAAEKIQQHVTQTDSNSCFREIIGKICNHLDNIQGNWS